MNRAYSVLTVKSYEPSGRKFSGIATTPTPDRVGDIIEPLGVSYKNPLPMLLFHDNQSPVGTVRFGRASADGIPFEAEIPEVTEPGEVKTLTDKAAHFVKYGLIRGVSIGFRPIGTDSIEIIKGGGWRFTKTEVVETSLVPIPANQEALIHTIKSLAQSDAAPGDDPRPEHVQRARVVAAPVVKARPEFPVKPISDQIKSFEDTRKEKDTARNALMTVAAEKGETLDAEAAEQYDTMTREIAAVDEHLVRLRALEASNKAAAVPVNGTSQESASQSRGSQALPTITVKDNLPPGIGMARVTIAKILARLDGSTVTEVAKARWPDHGALHAFIQKAPVAAGSTSVAATYGHLVSDPMNLASEFLEYLRPQTIIGRIPGLRRVPFNVRVVGQVTGASASWVGQGKPKPLTNFTLSPSTLLWTKIAAIAVLTEELVRFSSPSAEALVRDELARAVIERMDIDFIDPAKAAVSNVSPASITNGLTPLSSSGSTADNIRTDLATLLGTFIGNNVNPTSLVLIMPNSLAMAASMIVNALGQPEFTSLSMTGGTIMGIPVVASQYAATTSGAGNLVIALNASDIFLADDGTVRIDASTEASIEMSDAPAHDSITPTGASLVSMYQTNSIAIRAERFINWAKARSTAVVYMDDVSWGGAGSP